MRSSRARSRARSETPDPTTARDHADVVHPRAVLDRTKIGDEPPLAPGTSPFHIKGGGYLGHLAWVDANYPGGRKAFLDALSLPMREYFETVFLASAWYDILAIASAGHVCARTLGMPFKSFIAMRSRHQAQVDTSGMYRLLFKIASPRFVAARIPKVMSQYFDFGTPRITRDEDTGISFEVPGIPVILSTWFAGVWEGYFDIIVPAAGGPKPTVRAETSAHPSVHGFPAVTMRIDVRWA